MNCANTINNLGITYGHQGKYDQAITHYERALRIKKNAFGVDHINCANTINNLSITYRHQGKSDQAIAHYEWALTIYENAFGVDHINCADTIMNIGGYSTRVRAKSRLQNNNYCTVTIYSKLIWENHIQIHRKHNASFVTVMKGVASKMKSNWKSRLKELFSLHHKN